MIRIRLVLWGLAFCFWLLLNWPLSWGHALEGLIIGALAAYISGDVFAPNDTLFKRPQRYLWLVFYIPLFIWECIKANLDGAYRVLHPDLPIHPGIVRVKTALTSEAGLAFLANSLTLMPGTMTVDIDRHKGFIYVHWVNVRTQDAQQAAGLLVRRFERVLKRVFA
jgi:multicomponent Na+:H+ antiporter subunit E